MSQHGQRAGQGRARGGRAGGTHKEQGLWSLTRKGKEGAHERGQTTGEGDWPRHSIHVWAAGPAKRPKALRAGGPVQLKDWDSGFGSWEADCVCACVCTQSCPALHDPKDCNRRPLGSCQSRPPTPESGF